MESIKEKVKTKDAYIVELQEKIEKHHIEASEARKIEQVSHFQLNLGHSFPLEPVSLVITYLWCMLSLLYVLLAKFTAGMPKTGGFTDPYGTSSKAESCRDENHKGF
jgi:hypothetical protein